MESAPTPSEKQEGMSINDALLQVKAIEQQTHAMGGNDYEPEAFRQIIDELEASRLAPARAVQQAQGILDSKNSNYH